MSTLEMPACLALLLVMANLALCLSAERHLSIPATHQSGIVTLDGAQAMPLCGDAKAAATGC